MVIWNWFVPVVFPAAPLLTFWHAVGLAITVSIFSVHSPKKMEDFIDADVVAPHAPFEFAM